MCDLKSSPNLCAEEEEEVCKQKKRFEVLGLAFEPFPTRSTVGQAGRESGDKKIISKD